MSWIVVILTDGDAAGDDAEMGARPHSIRCNSQKTAEDIKTWLTTVPVKHRLSYVEVFQDTDL